MSRPRPKPNVRRIENIRRRRRRRRRKRAEKISGRARPAMNPSTVNREQRKKIRRATAIFSVCTDAFVDGSQSAIDLLGQTQGVIKNPLILLLGSV